MLSIINALQKYPRNVWILLFSSPMTMSVTSVMVLAGSLLARQLAPEPEWATLPLAFLVVGMAAAIVPAVYFIKSYGRRTGQLLGITAAIVGAATGMAAALVANFPLLLLSSLFFGISQAFVQQYRFAAIESLDDPQLIPSTLSLLMLSGIAAAFIGPEIAVFGKDLIPAQVGYAGSFLILGLLNVGSLLLMRNFKNPPLKSDPLLGEGRPLAAIVVQPIFLLALLAAVVGNGVMSFMMTATPLSMHDVDGIDLIHTKQVIQSHIIAMFAPSLLTSYLIKKFSVAPVLLLGSLIYLLTLLVASGGHEVLHYWWALVLLGIGWNALFLGGTTLLAQCYQASERFKAQAFNDFSIFFLQALASLSAGWVLFAHGWSQIIAIALPAVVVVLAFSVWAVFLQLKMRAKVLKPS